MPLTTPKKPARDLLFSWTDRLIPPEIKEDPLLHLRVQVGLFMVGPGTLISMSIIIFGVLASGGMAIVWLPLVLGHLLLWASASLLTKKRWANHGLTLIGALSTLMVIYAAYLNGGFSNANLAWFVAIPVMLTMFTGYSGALLGAGMCLATLVIFWLLEHAGHEFPVMVEQTSTMWVGVMGWCLLTTTALSVFIHSRFSRTVNAYQSEIDRRTKMEQSLRRAQQRLGLAIITAEAGAEAKGAFLAQVSHEIRNPLTAIMGAIDLLELPASAEVRASRIALLRRSSSALLHLVDDVLDFSKIESGRIEINPTTTDPVALAEELERTYRPIAHEKGIELLVEITPNPPRNVQIDALRVRQVLVNLMSNALKFTHEGTVTIELGTVELESGEPAIIYGIDDTGIGIPQEAHAQIFEPYTQAERSTTEDYGGTGLGLSICTRLVSLMGGELGFESDVGEGTRFWFTIPTQMETQTASMLAQEPLPPPKTAHVLVIENDDLNRQVVGQLLRSLGHKVTLASNGEDGFAMYKEQQPDLVLMDIQMPGLSGIQASILIRDWESQTQADRTPILAMTADVEVHQVARYGKAGMNDLLGKPICREKLDAAVKGWAVAHRA
jgi:signal transduction histidine kinase/ActR/RegA family two-component response regulator